MNNRSITLARVSAALFALMLLTLTAPWLPAQQMSIVNSLHNLSASSPATIRAASEEQVCIFCHTPHHASSVRPLWNRQLPTGTYIPYQSNSLKAAPGQPTGTSKLCLSCHDGTIALGNVLSRPTPIAMVGGVTVLPQGPTNLGIDLSKDHPISFAYDQTLIQKNPKLKNPTGLDPAVKLDSSHELQCTSCHDPHNNQYGKFLVMNNAYSQLCNTCHNQGATTITAHSNCSTCHQSHNSPSGPYLLKGQTVTASCTLSPCHNTQSSDLRLNIAADLNRISKHDTNSAVNLPNHVPDNIDCSDCHEGHTMGNINAAGAPAISPRLGKIDGISNLGGRVAPAQFEYEVCFKCHADRPTRVASLIPRVLVQTNLRLQTVSTAISFHPIQAIGKNTNDVPSLISPWTPSSMVYCGDCHGSSPSTGRTGPHGSDNTPLLVAACSTADGTAESYGAYALCYTCHQRDSILQDQSFPLHHLHIVDQSTPCSVCHDSHGISSVQGQPANNAHLINFDTSVVRREPITGQIVYTSTGINQGMCTLLCHGEAHLNRPYGGMAGTASPLMRRSPAKVPGAAVPVPPARKAP